MYANWYNISTTNKISSKYWHTKTAKLSENGIKSSFLFYLPNCIYTVNLGNLQRDKRTSATSIAKQRPYLVKP